MTNITNEMQTKLMRALKECFECYTLQDILDDIKNSKMQSFVVGDSWAVTQISDFPRRRIIECFLAIGRAEDISALNQKIENFAKEVGATGIRAFGRDGFKELAAENDWKSGQRIYYKEIG